MNLQALFDGLLAITAFYIAWGPARSAPALRLGNLLLGSAAVLGALRFSGVLALPQLHQYFSMLGAGVGLPMLAIALTQPHSAVATQRRYAWIFAVIAAGVCTLIVMVAQWKLWTSVCAIMAALGILGYGVLHKRLLTAAAGLLMLLTLIAFASKAQVGSLLPGDILHIGLAVTLALTGWWAIDTRTTRAPTHGCLTPPRGNRLRAALQVGTAAAPRAVGSTEPSGSGAHSTRLRPPFFA